MRRTSLLFFFVASAVLAFLITSTVVGGARNSNTGQQQHPGPPKNVPAYERAAHGSGGRVSYMDRSKAGKATAIIEVKKKRENRHVDGPMFVPGAQ